MYKYNLKDFFKETTIQNDEWVSNGHFLFKKPVLTAGQRKMIEGFPPDNRISQLLSIVDTAKKIFDDQKERFEFAPDLIFEYTTKTVEPETFNVLYNNSLDLALKEEYYNFFISKKCKILKGNGSLNPTLIFKDDEFVGVLLPVRSSIESRENEVDYNRYITKLEQEQIIKKALDTLNKKCLYISNNKATVRNRQLINIQEIIGKNEEYSNIYFELTNSEYAEIFIDLDIIFMSINKSIDKRDKVEEIKSHLHYLTYITLDSYKRNIDISLNQMKFINVAEIKLMEIAGESKEYVEKLKQHRQYIYDLREKESQERQLKKQQEEQDYIDSKNKLVDNAITEAEQKILNKEKVINNDITIYKSKYDSTTTSLILHLMKLYDIKVPLKTQGWINKALHNITYNSEYGWSYHYYKSSSDSTVFMKYLKELVNKVEEKHKNVA